MLEYLFAKFALVRSEEDGQTAVEYALVLLLVALVLTAALAAGLTGLLSDALNQIKNAI